MVELGPRAKFVVFFLRCYRNPILGNILGFFAFPRERFNSGSRMDAQVIGS